MPTADESTTIQLCGVTMSRVQLPKRLPYPQYRSRIKEHFMTEGEGGPGIRVIEPLGAHISYSDFEFAAGFLTAANIVTFETAFLDQRTPQTLTITVPGDSTVTYYVLFDANGLEVMLQDSFVGYDEDLYSAIFKLKILYKS